MADTFRLTVVTPERMVFDGDVVSVTAPGADGYFGVLAHHAPMLAGLGVGQMTVERADGSRELLAVAGGFMEVNPDGAMVLADSAERQADIDVARAQAAEARARERLVQHHTDVARAEAALMRAMNRLTVATHR